jgi:hypothetical protein
VRPRQVLWLRWAFWGRTIFSLAAGVVLRSRRRTAAPSDPGAAADLRLSAGPAAWQYRARYYDSTTGRFLSEDPLSFLAGGPNFYSYVGNDPVDFWDPAKQSKTVRQNDPSKTMREGKSVDHAVKDAFASGLLTLSEIAFNKDHSKAVMSYSFFCGRLCGNGAVVMLKRVGRKWKVTKQSCGEWVS